MIMSRFNLWEKVDTDTSTPEEDMEKEVTDEVPEDEEDVESEVEGEEEDTLYNLMADFILALPEESITDELKDAYEAVVDRIGDEYLVGEGEDSEEGSESEEEDEEDPKKDEDLEESLANELENPYPKSSGEYEIFEKFKKYGKGSAKIGRVSKNSQERLVADKFLEMLGESVIKESKDMTGNQLATEIENTIKKYFPESFVRAKFGTDISPSIAIKFAIGKDKSEWSNGIIHNDPAHTSILVWGFDKDGNQKSDLTMSSGTAGYSNWKTKTKDRCGWRDIKKGGTATKVLKALDNHFSKLKDVYEADGGRKALGLTESKETDTMAYVKIVRKDGTGETKYVSLSDLNKLKNNPYVKSVEEVKRPNESLPVKQSIEENKQTIWKRTTAFDRL
jgi:hypothetical protein